MELPHVNLLILSLRLFTTSFLCHFIVSSIHQTFYHTVLSLHNISVIHNIKIIIRPCMCHVDHNVFGYYGFKIKFLKYLTNECIVFCTMCVFLIYVTGPAKIDHVSTKNHQFLACLLHHNLIIIYTTATKSSSLLRNLMDFLLQLTEMG